ncbi:MAG: hypothetical protein KGY54_02030 [Oleiphilaceae bacterium]|nr:hypothetical protein [Oleiphilaceae bacterium]
MAKHRYQLTLKDYLTVARQRSGLLFCLSVGILLLTLTIALTLPPVFRSAGIILAESSQIPSEFVPFTNNLSAEERVQVISQRIMTHRNFLQIAEKYELYANDKNVIKRSELVKRMRESISLRPMSEGPGHGARAIAFEVAFEDASADIAQSVASELVRLFLSENARVRRARATEATAFLKREADKLQEELSRREEALADYKQRHANALPEHLEIRMAMLQRLESDLGNVRREFRSTQEQLRSLDIELSYARSGRRLGSSSSRDDHELSVPELEAKYEQLDLRFTSRHPDMQALRRRIEARKASAIPESEFLQPPLSESDVQTAKIQAQINAMRSDQDALRKKEDQLRNRVAEVEEQILQTPQVQRTLTGIMRDYANARDKYDEFRAKQIDAGISETLEDENRAENFSLLEPPLSPDTPARPDRKRILLAGAFLTVANAGGLVVLFASLSPRVNGRAALSQFMRQSPLAVIPYIKNRADMRRQRLRIFGMLALSVASLIFAGVLIHFFHTDLGFLVLRMATLWS